MIDKTMASHLEGDEYTNFIIGMSDCEEGIEHKMGMSEDYTRGYAAQFQLEQNRSHHTRMH